MTSKVASTLAVAVVLTPLVPGAAHADYVYEYVGSTFNYGMSQGVTYAPPTENLVATIDSASPLAANATYTFGEGLSTPGVFYIGLGAATCTGYQCANSASITTNSIGAISSWSLYYQNDQPGAPTITGASTAARYSIDSDSIFGQQGFYSVPLFDAIVDNNGFIGPDYVLGSTNVGTWTLAAPAVPLPASAYLLFSGLCGIGMAAWRRRMLPTT